MGAKRGLGRGLNDIGKGLETLIPDYVPTEDEIKGARELKLIEVEPNKEQPRKKFDKEKLELLADSIKEHGVIQPILVRKTNDRYEIIAGERRWRAARIAGLKTIPAIIKDFDGSTVMEIALIENLQREDLNPIEEAKGYNQLIKEFKFTQEDVAKKVGISRSAVANSLRLLKLSEDVQTLLENGDITEGHAKVILALPIEQQFPTAKLIIDNNLTVRDTEKLIAKQNKKEEPVSPQKEAVKRYLESLEQDITKYVGSKVHIVSGKKKGKIEIEYYNDDDFNRILSILKGEKI